MNPNDTIQNPESLSPTDAQRVNAAFDRAWGKANPDCILTISRNDQGEPYALHFQSNSTVTEEGLIRLAILEISRCSPSAILRAGCANAIMEAPMV